MARFNLTPAGETALKAALQLKTAESNYNTHYKDVIYRLERAAKDVADSSRYGDTVGAQAGNVITAVREISSNMRMDLLAKYASEIDAARAVLAAMDPYLTDEDRAQIARFR